MTYVPCHRLKAWLFFTYTHNGKRYFRVCGWDTYRE